MEYIKNADSNFINVSNVLQFYVNYTSIKLKFKNKCKYAAIVLKIVDQSSFSIFNPCLSQGLLSLFVRSDLIQHFFLSDLPSGDNNKVKFPSV